ncbi:MAG: hypothetical protein A3F73_12135 [Gallionellales bacterium RIFCSPLOWO2_12_FULL_59_22]|nr:MAG: hypothetical protein A3H99_01440 [Gallionellales bacterium RIFCSPLOWO2_02_FULL_59_110]OGT12212.1 MAG: hypothetical protein A3F73_12135 [Gallionellales bacterium RIFCSPLOWO2_12_FULL_59_22]
MRQLKRIATPQLSTPQATQALPPGARAAASARPVSRAKVEAAVKQIASAWNTQQLEPLLAKNFYDKRRLMDSLGTIVPRDAKLRVLGIQGVQTLNQYVQAGARGEQLVSRVSATLRTQVEFNDPSSGFRRLEGDNEVILLVYEPAS